MSLEYSVDAAHVIRSALSLLRPYDVPGARKVRLGRPFDGGYVMIDAFDGVEAAYSLGINDDVSWDSDIASRGIDIFQYDHTIDSLPFQDSKFHFHKLGISAFSSETMRSIPDIIRENGHENSRNLLLKCDIELSEWEVLRYIPGNVMAQFSQIVIELHDVKRLGDPEDAAARRALAGLTNYHRVVHVHGNNYGGTCVVGGISLPNVLEITLLRKDMCPWGEVSNIIFPTPMDMPCDRSKADIFLGRFEF